jgi:hypothetical protein
MRKVLKWYGKAQYDVRGTENVEENENLKASKCIIPYIFTALRCKLQFDCTFPDHTQWVF